MPVAQVTKAVVFEDSGAFFMARVKGNAGTSITQASVSSISYAVYDMATQSSVISGLFTVSSVVFDSLQTTDPRWTVDTTGYNFLWAAPATLAPIGDRKYRVEIVFTPASGAAFPVIYECSAIGLLSS